MEIRKTLREAAIRFLGIQSVVEDNRGTPESIANQMDASRITAALSEAESGYVYDLWNLYDSIIAGDSWIQSMLEQRKLAVLSDPILAVPEDLKNPLPEDVEAARIVNASIRNIRRFKTGCCSHLLDGILRPVALCELVFRQDDKTPGKYLLDRITPVPHYCEDFRNGRLQLRRQDPKNQGRVTDDLYDVEPGRHIVHRGHMLSMPDNWGGPMRSLLFLWLLKTCDREWWARSLERWGAPVPVGKYPSGDTKAKLALRQAFDMFHRLGGLIMADNTSVELVAGPAAGDGTAWKTLQDWAERQITIRILGQELSTGAEATGLGSGVAELHSRVRDDIVLMDETALAETLTTDLVPAILSVNDTPGHCRIVIGTGTNLAKGQTLANILSPLYTAGVEVADDGLSSLGEMIGLPLRRAEKPVGMTPGQFATMSQLFPKGGPK